MRPLHTLSSLAVGLALASLLLDLTAPALSRATNGLNLIASGGISSALAGADTAVATDFTAMNTNPAGMTQIRGQHAGLSLGVLQPKLRHRDSQNDKDSVNGPLIIPNLGYIRHLSDTRITLGIGFFTIGGNASDFQDLRTQFGTTDKTSTQLRHYKIAPSIAYEVTDKLSLGASLGISYADVSLAVIPNTAIAPNPLVPTGVSGFETTGKCDRMNGLAPPGTCAFAFGLTPKFGAMYKLNDMVTFGLAYTMKASLPFGRGRVAKNQPGIGIVTYDASVSGFKWPDDLSAGVALRPNKDLLIAFKFQWINWDAALNSATINLTNGDNPARPTDSINLQYKWRDQYVAAVGATYDVTERLNIRGGYNFGNNPVPKSTLDPTNANIVEHHLVGGAAYWVTPALRLEGAFTYALTNGVTYNSATWGNNTRLEVGGYDLVFTLSYRPAQ